MNKTRRKAVTVKPTPTQTYKMGLLPSGRAVPKPNKTEPYRKGVF